MKIIAPITIGDSSGYTTTAVESKPLWVSGTTYDVGDVTYYDTSGSHRLWRRLSAGAGTTQPHLDKANWRDAGPNNKWAALDMQTSLPTQGYPSLEFVFSLPSMTNYFVPGETVAQLTMGLYNLRGVTATVQTFAPDLVTVTSSTSQGISNYNSKKSKALVFENLPLNSGNSTKFRVFLDGNLGPTQVTCQCSAIAIGPLSNLGETLHKPRLSMVSYSKKSTDEFGVTTLAKGANSKRLSAQMVIPNSDISRVYGEVSALDGTPVGFITSDIANLEPLHIFGFSRDFSVEVEYATQSLCSIEIEAI